MKKFLKTIKRIGSIIYERCIRACPVAFGFGTNSSMAATAIVGAEYADQIDAGANRGLGEILANLNTNIGLGPTLAIGISIISGIVIAIWGLLQIYRAVKDDTGRERMLPGVAAVFIGALLASILAMIGFAKGTLLGQTGG